MSYKIEFVCKMNVEKDSVARRKVGGEAYPTVIEVIYDVIALCLTSRCPDGLWY